MSTFIPLTYTYTDDDHRLNRIVLPFPIDCTWINMYDHGQIHAGPPRDRLDQINIALLPEEQVRGLHRIDGLDKAPNLYHFALHLGHYRLPPIYAVKFEDWPHVYKIVSKLRYLALPDTLLPTELHGIKWDTWDYAISGGKHLAERFLSYLRKKMHYRLVELAIAMAPLHLPAYPLMWLIDFLPHFADMRDIVKIGVIERVYKSGRRVQQLRDTPASTAKRRHVKPAERLHY